MKILIADDEPKICQLISKLVDWDSMDMSVIAVAHDGLDALSAIQKYKPDIVITDIRMPGYDGLELIRRAQECSPDTEFIIISGYRQFEYAKNAIHYGVKNYLLKPIQKVELTETLAKIRNGYIQKHSDITKEEKYQLLMETNRNQKRTEFLQDIFFKNNSGITCSGLTNINSIYSFTFQEGYFQTAIIKLDGLDRSMQRETEYIYGKIRDFITNKLPSICYDSACITEDSFCYILLNFEPGNQKCVRSSLKKFLNELLCQKEVLHHLNVTLAIGSAHSTLNDVPTSLKTARLAIEQRLVLGTNILLDETHYENVDIDSCIFQEFSRRFSTAIDRLSENELYDCFSYLKKQLSQTADLSGHAVLQLSKEIIQHYIVSMNTNSFVIPDKETFADNFYKALDNQSSWQDVLTLLSKTILDSCKASFNTRKQEANKPVREAKNYIKAHLKETISLEQISTVAGFNSSYFSSLFKKETGITFSEYLIQVRMEQAKELLKGTDWNISVICEEVGYSDLKNFNKNFKKYTGLRPNEFRRIYS
ncbi:response regulator [Blautia schinkii]|nr:response regulator [Blautia schinkii]